MTAAGEDDFPEVRFENRIGFLDIVELVFTRATLSPGLQIAAGFFITLALLFILAAGPADVWVPFLIVGVFAGTGFIVLPFTWWTYIAVPELMDETVEADPSGMRIHVLDRIVEHPWTVYRTATETNRLFLLRSRVVPTQLFTKRRMAAPDIEAFRAILAEVGLLSETLAAQRRKAGIGFIVGVVIAVTLPLLLNAYSLLAPA